jgi:glycosyltransferase involved in cell wall biosynthesis
MIQTEKMRILMLAQFYPPIAGGIEQHVRTLSIELVLRGYDVAVATMRHKGQPEFAIDQGVRVYRIRSSVQRIPWLFSDSERQYPTPLPDPETMLELRRVILKEQPQIVHAHNWLVRSFLPLKTWSKARLIVTLHDYNLTCAKVNYIYDGKACSGAGIVKCPDCVVKHYGLVRGMPTVLGNWAMDIVERSVVDLFLAVSQAVVVGNKLADYHLPFRIIPNFIADDPAIIEEDARAYLEQLPVGDFLLFVGGLWRVKGIDVLLRAYSELTNVPPLVLIGYPAPDWAQMVSECSGNVIVFKDWPHSAVMAAWGRCSLAIIPSIGHDPCPTVAMEAMVMGKPVIATSMGGLIDIVAAGETGLLVPPGDAQALREAIQSLLVDPARREHMGKMAQHRVTEFQAKSVVPRVEQAYHDVLTMPHYAPT